MAFAAPALVEGAAGTAAAGGAAAGAGAAETAGASAGVGGRRAVKTAKARAGELAGQPRYKARRALRDELGATSGQADDLLDAAAADQPADEPADEPARRRSSSSSQLGGAIGGQLGRSVGNGLNASGGFVLGALAYVLFLVYLRGGTPAVKSWLAAKFLNRTGSVSTGAATEQVAPSTVTAGYRLAPYGGAAPRTTSAPTPAPATTSSGRTWSA
ncbi:MAG: hypothetical protein BGO38_06945 [Cellulomonas sp. 73-145]|uniref:hypothetical protein n=1 Tax=Cellulomonas sp. 73-145 TaxID=1895739 RepID=UPI00092B2A4B|nr:hypothetical protein [Cellulomonas sp. 73-145]OJV57953.1 MAG: hypothetical protein BGO38_06945 [Cellulomonas sp. 73-145]